MILRKPDFYDKFKCKASRCTDTCCIGWEIDVDENSQGAYNKVTGTFGDKLRASIENGHFKLLPHDRCPFLDKDNLCEIYTNLGEGALCDICREHPRFVEVYGDIMERGLGLCCEEAARLLLEGEGPLTFVSEECDEPEDELDDDDREIRDQVLYERDLIFKTLADFNKPLVNGQVTQPEDARRLYELLAKTESFGPAWNDALARIKTRLDTAGIGSQDAAPLQDEGYFSRTESARLLAYLIYRHYAKCLFEGREQGKRNFAFFFWNAARFFTRELADDASDSQSIKINAIKILSRQLEYSEENMELIENELDG